MPLITRLRAVAFGLLAAVGLAAAVPGAALAEGYGKQKVVYHVNGQGGEDAKAYRAAMNNVQNHINAVGVDNVEIAVVMHGDGLGLLSDSMTNDKLQTQVASLKGQKVRFLVCNNTLVGREIDPETDLYDVWPEDIVPSGVAELSNLQMQGYTYVKP